jgi:hypothetical protein
MDELTLVAQLRDDIPDAFDLTGPQRRLADEIGAAAVGAAGRPGAGRTVTEPRREAGPVRGRRHRAHRVPRILVAAGAAVVVAAVAVIVVSHTGTTPSSPGASTALPPARGSHPGPAVTAMELVADATRAAQATPNVAPNPRAWVYVKTEAATSASTAQNGTLLGPVNGTTVSRQWSRVDGKEVAFVQDGKLMVAPGGGIPGTWQSNSYSYFASLPTNPARLTAMIEANNKTDNYVVGGGAIGVFNAVEALLEAPVILPPKLLAALYAVLAGEPGVNFEPHVTDIAGRPDAAFFIDQEGYDRSEILINPATYDYMGQLDVAYHAYTYPAQVNNGVASGPYTHIKAGQIMDEEALLQRGLVQRPGQVLP